MKRFISIVLSLALVLTVFAMGASAAVVTEAPQNDRMFDDFNRSGVENIKAGGDVLWVAPRFASGYGATITDGVLELSYEGKNDYFGEGTEIKLENYCYLVMKVKGAAGGEGDDFSLTTEYDESSAKRKIFSSYVGPDNKPIPAITTEWQYIVLDMVKSGMGKDADPDFLDLTFHFESGKSGKIYIDEIYLTNQEFDFAVDIPSDQIPTVPTPSQAETQPSGSGSDPIIVDKDQKPVPTEEIKDADGNKVIIGIITDEQGNKVPVRVVVDEDGSLKTVESVTNEQGIEEETKDATLPEGYTVIEPTGSGNNQPGGSENKGGLPVYMWVILVLIFALILCGAVYLSRRKKANPQEAEASDENNTMDDRK